MVYFGSYLNAIDVKSRVSVPPKFRALVTAQSTERELLIGKSRFYDCLVCYDYGYVAALNADLESRFGEVESLERTDASRAAFGGLAPHNIDDGHRITLSERLCKRVGIINRQALFVGAGRYFEIWDPRAYIALPSADPEIADSARDALIAKGETV